MIDKPKTYDDFEKLIGLEVVPATYIAAMYVLGPMFKNSLCASYFDYLDLNGFIVCVHDSEMFGMSLYRLTASGMCAAIVVLGLDDFPLNVLKDMKKDCFVKHY